MGRPHANVTHAGVGKCHASVTPRQRERAHASVTPRRRGKMSRQRDPTPAWENVTLATLGASVGPFHASVTFHAGVGKCHASVGSANCKRELALRGDRKKFQNVQAELRDYDRVLRPAGGKVLPGGSGVQPLRCRSAAPARSASAKDAEHDCWRGHSRAPAHLLLLHAGSHAALGRAGAVAKAGGVPMGVSSPTGKKRRK